MEFWIIQGTEYIQLPVPPSEFTISKENNNEVVNVETLGEINLIGKEKLSSISLSSFFSWQKYPFVKVRNLLKPYEYTKIIDSFRTSGKPIRLLITETDINDFFTIDNFEYGERDGSGDVYFTITFRQYKVVTITTQVVVKKTTTPATSAKTTKKVINRKVARAKTREDHIKQIKQPAYKQKGYVSYKEYMLAEKV
ncbi:hypothetical protein SAMN05443428_13511 [Caloramator quimbayensis]|uniref:Uncharacterized protein n=1 Tax=Caloramator quimbayensis TaxID=1147123 RepID=A0A1T4YCS2_9CLOT|nr:hypothetical protein [Caloramator quimbayensis]SKA99328.1 hypothetical protein SAMN05443428_13511 [Caloramator quimbayensis]